MTKEDTLRFYQGCIDSAEAEVEELREELDKRLEYLGQMNMKKGALLYDSPSKL
jgi:hypothetical protein